VSAEVIAILSTQIVSVLICFILGYGYIVEAKTKTTRGNLFLVMTATVTLALIADGVTWVIDGNEKLTVLAFICVVLSLTISLILLSMYALYVGTSIIEKSQNANGISTIIKVILWVNIAFIVAILIMSFTGSLFTITNGIYSVGNLYYLYIIFCITSMIFTSIVVIANSKVLGKREVIVSLVYLVFPFISAILSVFIPNASYGYQASALALLIIYIFIQSEENKKLNEEKVTNEYYANHDTLTGVNSRKAFTKTLDASIKKLGNVGVIFCDVNGLKYTNDHYGHKAGDTLLIDFATLLKDSFSEDEIFRISGDEFVVIMLGSDKKSFSEKVLSFEEKIGNGTHRIACIGEEYGSCQKVEELLQMAEKKMYVSKEEYHKSHPDSSR